MLERQNCLWKTKYDPSKAVAYRPGKHEAELGLINRVFREIPSGSVLDVPCGNGRLSVHLAKTGKYALSAADYSESMLVLASSAIKAQGIPFPVEKEDIESMSYPDRRSDTVLCFRLFHHYPDKTTRQKTVAELCRVANEYVVISYFSPFSVTSWKRRFRVLTGGKKPKKYSTPLSEVNGYFANHGFELVRDFAQLSFLHTLHVALYRRKQEIPLAKLPGY